VLLGLSACNRGRQNQPKVYKPIDHETVVAYEKLGATHITIGTATSPFQFRPYEAGTGLPGFRFDSLPQVKLPEVSVPFGIVLTDAGGKKVADAALKELASLKNLTALHLLNPPVTDAGLKELAALPNLTTLSLSAMSVTEGGLKGLASLQNLTALNLRAVEVTDVALKEMAGLKNLSILDLSNTTVKGAGSQEVYQGGRPVILPTQVTDGRLKELAPLKKLATLYLDHSQVTDEGLRSLREVGLLHTVLLSQDGFSLAEGKDGARPHSAADVRTLHLSMTGVTDAGLKELTGLKNLTTLELNSARVTDAGLKELAAFKKLTTLDLSGTKVTDAGLKDLAALKNLTTLYLTTTGVKGAGLKDLAPLRNLTTLHVMSLTDASLLGMCEGRLLHALADRKTSKGDIATVKGKGGARPKSEDEVIALDLRYTPVTEEGLKGLVALKNLASLNLAHTAVKDEDLKDLAALKSLTSLNLEHTGVTDAGIGELAALRGLNTLNLGGTRVTNEGRAVLRKKIPGCSITLSLFD
jgi:Leucine-rich repeat (LRR) protein